MPLFDRIINVQIGEKVYPNNLRISFEIEKTNESILNTANIKIYNLSEASRGQIKDLNTVINLAAGYREYGGPKLVFTGNVLRVNHKFNLPDIVTEIDGGDGAKAVREARQSISFEEGTEVKTVLEGVAGNLGLDIRELPKDVKGVFEQGFSHIGPVKECLDKLCQRIESTWSIQDNQLQITKDSSASVHAPVRVTQVDGLLERLERLGDVRKFAINDADQVITVGYRFRTLLNPDIQPGRIVTLTAYSGRYRVERVKHEGDNFEDKFISTVEVKEIGNAN